MATILAGRQHPLDEAARRAPRSRRSLRSRLRRWRASKARALAFFQQYDEEWPSIFDPSGAKAKRLAEAEGPLSGATAPTTFFLDRRHRIVAVVYGQGSLPQFDAAYRKAKS
jgi:hypothetical protein